MPPLKLAGPGRSFSALFGNTLRALVIICSRDAACKSSCPYSSSFLHPGTLLYRTKYLFYYDRSWTQQPAQTVEGWKTEGSKAQVEES